MFILFSTNLVTLYRLESKLMCGVNKNRGSIDIDDREEIEKPP